MPDDCTGADPCGRRRRDCGIDNRCTGRRRRDSDGFRNHSGCRWGSFGRWNGRRVHNRVRSRRHEEDHAALRVGDGRLRYFRWVPDNEVVARGRIRSDACSPVYSHRVTSRD